MILLSSITACILLTQTSLVFSHRGFGHEELDFGLTGNKLREMRIRQLCDRLGIKYGELIARKRKHRRNQRQIIHFSERGSKLEIPERQAIDDFLVSRGRTRPVSPRKKTVVPKRRKSRRKIKLNFGKLSQMFKSSSINKINKDIDRKMSHGSKEKIIIHVKPTKKTQSGQTFKSNKLRDKAKTIRKKTQFRQTFKSSKLREKVKTLFSKRKRGQTSKRNKLWEKTNKVSKKTQTRQTSKSIKLREKVKELFSKRKRPRPKFRLNIFKKSKKRSKYSSKSRKSTKRRKIKLNLSMLSSLAEKSRKNKKNNLSDRTLQKSKVRFNHHNRFEKPDRKVLRQFSDIRKSRKNKSHKAPVFITRAPPTEAITTTTTEPTTKTTTTTPTTTTSTTTQTTTTSTTTTTLPPTTTTIEYTTYQPADDINTEAMLDFIDPVTNVDIKFDINKESRSSSDTNTQTQRTRFNLSNFQRSKSSDISGKSKAVQMKATNPPLKGRTRIRLDFSSFPTARSTTENTGSPTTSEINEQVPPTKRITTPRIRLNIPDFSEPRNRPFTGNEGSDILGESEVVNIATTKRPEVKGRTRIRLDFSSFPTASSTATNTDSPTTSEVNRRVRPTERITTSKVRLNLPNVPQPSKRPIGSSTSGSPRVTGTTDPSEIDIIENQILNQLRQTPEFIRASRVNTPEADMKLKEVLDGILIDFSTQLPTDNQRLTTSQANTIGQTRASLQNTTPTPTEQNQNEGLSTTTSQNRRMLIPKRFSQSVSNDDKAGGESDWMFIESELKKLLP